MLPIFSPLRNLQGFNGYVPGLGADTDVHPSLCVQVFRQRSFLGREDGVTDALRQRSLPPAEPFPGGWNVCAGCDRLAPLLLPPPTPPPSWGLLYLSKQGSEGGGPCGLQNVARSPPPLSLSLPFGLVMTCE